MKSEIIINTVEGHLVMKKMKIGFLLFLTVLMACQSCRPTRERGTRKTILTGKIESVSDPTIQFSYDTYSLLEPTKRATIDIDSTGEFKLVLDLKNPIKGVLSFGRDMIQGRGFNKLISIYLEPGDDLYVTADVNVLKDTNIIQNTLIFSGKNKQNSEFLNHFETAFNSYEQLKQNNYAFIVRLNPNEYKKCADSILNTQLKYLEEYDQKADLSPQLKEISIAEYKNLAAARKIVYPSSNKSYNQGKEVVLPPNYYDFINTLHFSADIDHVGLPYLRFMNFYYQNKYNLEIENKQAKSYSSFLNEELTGRRKYILLAYSLSSNFNADVYLQVSKNNPYKDIREKVRIKYHHMESMLPGRPSPDVIFWRTQDKSEKSDNFFKGKYIYIDFWATWCKPCIKEIPDLVKLKNEYKDFNIEFVSVSVDEDNSAWKEFVAKQKLTGVQFWVDGSNKKIYDKNFNITMIPRFVLIDDNGKIVNANAPRPSSGNDIRQLLNKELKKK